MKIKHLILLSLILFATPFSLSLMVAHADNSNNNNGDTQDLQDKIDEYEKKLSKLQGSEKTLANELSFIDSQTQLTELRIQNSLRNIKKKEQEIQDLSDNIDVLKDRILKLEQAISFQQDVLNKRLRARYKTLESSPILLLFGSDTLNQIIQKTEYLKVMETEDSKLLIQMAETKANFDDQRQLFEKEKGKKEELKQQLISEEANLENYRANLQDQADEKKRLLEVTQNDEKKYQSLLAEAQKELNQITGAVSVLKNKESEKVKQGDIIGTQGSSGVSTGDHLHFGVYKYKSFADIDGWNWYYSNYVDPSKMLKNKSVYWNTGCQSAGYRTTGSGDWRWPIDSPTISQGFGHTCWSNIYYGGKDHPAYDMYGSYGTAVRAVADGNAYFCRNCLGDGGNGVFIFHDNGYMTLYWHLR